MTQEIRAPDFQRMISCDTIDVSESQIKELENDSFHRHCQLTTLNLNNNQLQILPEEIFYDLELLQNLKMRNNFLKALEKNIFKFNRKLEYLDVSNNMLVSIHSSIFKKANIWKFGSFKNNSCLDLMFPEVTLIELKNKVISSCYSERQNVKLKVFPANTLLKDQKKARRSSLCVPNRDERKVIKIITQEIHYLEPKSSENTSMSVDDQESSQDVINSGKNFTSPMTNSSTKSSTLKNSFNIEPTMSSTVNAANISKFTTEPTTTFSSSTICSSQPDIIVGLFWLIIPIILILFLILAIICWAIYKKYIKYSVSAQRRY